MSSSARLLQIVLGSATRGNHTSSRSIGGISTQSPESSFNEEDLIRELRSLGRRCAARIAESPRRYASATKWLAEIGLPVPEIRVDRESYESFPSGQPIDVGGFRLVSEVPSSYERVGPTLPDCPSLPFARPRPTISSDAPSRVDPANPTQCLLVSVESVLTQYYGEVPRRLAAAWNQVLVDVHRPYLAGTIDLGDFNREQAARAGLLIALLFDPDFDGMALGLSWPWKDSLAPDASISSILEHPSNGRRAAIGLLEGDLQMAIAIATEAEYILALPIPSARLSRRSPKRKCGSRGLDMRERERRVLLLARWAQAKDGAMSRVEFCRSEELTEEYLRTIENWDRKQRSRRRDRQCQRK